MITVTIVFDDKEGDEHSTPGALRVDLDGATVQEMACLLADGVEIFAEAMAKIAEHYANDEAVANLTLSRIAAGRERFRVEEVDHGNGFDFKPFFKK